MIVHTDGGARGNPGPAAVGVYIPELSKKYSKYLGTKTNNEAEYEAVTLALKKIKQLLGTAKAKQETLEFKLDSELVVKQLNGQYKIMEEKLKPMFMEIWNGKQDFRKVTFSHIPREENSMADQLVNEALDAQEEQQEELF